MGDFHIYQSKILHNIYTQLWLFGTFNNTDYLIQYLYKK